MKALGKWCPDRLPLQPFIRQPQMLLLMLCTQGPFATSHSLVAGCACNLCRNIKKRYVGLLES